MAAGLAIVKCSTCIALLAAAKIVQLCFNKVQLV